MKRLVVALACVSIAGCPSGWRFERVEGERASIHPGMYDEIHDILNEIDQEAKADASCARFREPLFHCAEDRWRDQCTSSPTGRGAPVVADCTKLRSLYSFVHTSDAQLKEHRVRMMGDISEIAYDGLTNGALRHPDLERHDDAALLATVAAINRLEHSATSLKAAFAPCPAPAPPRFVIHTGDAVDAGLFSELIQFLAVMQELRLPFYNAIGNHDMLFFGTFPPEHMRGLNVLTPYVPIVDADRFMRFHSVAGPAFDSSLPNLSNRDSDHVPTQRGCAFGGPRDCRSDEERCRDAACSSHHGFDLACYEGREKNAVLCPEARGYYSFDVELPPSGGRDRKLRIIVLNTAEVVPETVHEGFERLSKANLQPEQLRWLTHELDRGAAGADVYHLVLGHHRLSGFLHSDQATHLLELLLARERVLGYLAGHGHRDAFVAHPREPHLREPHLREPHLRYQGVLWEIAAGSTLVYPQLARMVELFEETNGSGRLLLRIASFRQQLSDGVAAIEAPRCHQLAKRAHLARAGAADDADADRLDESEAVPRANGLMVVYQPPSKAPAP